MEDLIQICTFPCACTSKQRDKDNEKQSDVHE